MVMTAKGQLVEAQGTAEGEPFSREAMDRLMNLARDGINELLQIQRQILST
jgi:ribonuclease PH